MLQGDAVRQRVIGRHPHLGRGQRVAQYSELIGPTRLRISQSVCKGKEQVCNRMAMDVLLSVRVPYPSNYPPLPSVAIYPPTYLPTDPHVPSVAVYSPIYLPVCLSTHLCRMQLHCGRVVGDHIEEDLLEHWTASQHSISIASA